MPHPLKVTVLVLAWRIARVVVVVLACVLALAFALYVGAWDAAFFGGSP